ncbi:MAG TPA: questin oxidase family protein [Candidatus Margulisiibacteriota bacterium]|nr:questin oxidase family protein [Candidatus Margulisiibacteriota bacterium]
MTAAPYASMDEALEMLAAYGPDLRNGLTNHAPMAVEALCAMGRPEAVMPWAERYRAGMLPRSGTRQRITRDTWRAALAQLDRAEDWSMFFREELEDAPWREVLNRWVGQLAPGICASATHGVIRVGHAARSLAESASPQRRRELADALASWAYAYQELPTSRSVAQGPMRPHAAIMHVAVVPPARRVFTGTITSSLEALSEFPDFAPVIELLDVSGDPVGLVSELTDVFARVYLANTHDVLTAIVFIHGVTSVAALGNLLPYLDDATARAALRFAWQASCGLFAAFGSRPVPAAEIEPPRTAAATLVDMAVAHGDEHAIKFTEACLRQHTLRPSPAYLAAALHALEILPRG